MAGQKTKVQANNRFVYMAYYRDTPLLTGDSPQLWFLDPDMAYAFPTDDDLTMLACVPHKDRIPEFKADPEAAMARMFERVPGRAAPRPGQAGLEDARQTRRPQRTAPARPATGYALVGDAALAADPLWGVGIGWAFQTGEWLAEEVGPALGDEAELDRALRATRAGTAGRWPGTTASAPPTRAGAGSTRSKGSSSAPRPATRSSPGASPCSASAGSSPGSSSRRARSG